MATWMSKFQATDENVTISLEGVTMLKIARFFGAAVLGAAIPLIVALFACCGVSVAQTPTASAPAAARQIGTVKSVGGDSLTLTTDAGQAVVVSVADGA